MNKPMKIQLRASRAAHIRILAGPLDRAAGSHVYHYELARRLAERGYKVSVIAFPSRHAFLKDVAIESFEIPDFSRAPLIWRYSSFLKYWYCAKLIRTSHLDVPDIVIGGEHLWLKAHARRFHKAPWIYLPHSLTVRDEITNSGMTGAHLGATLGLYRGLQAWAIENADCILRFTRPGCTCLKSEYPKLTFAPFVVNEIGIDAPTSVAKRELLREPRLLILGRMIFSKGIDIALDSLAQLKEMPWKLTIVGDGAERDALVRQARRVGLSDRVVFAGSTISPADWYVQSDLLLFPSRSESLGLVPLEAMAHGLPCLAFRPNGWDVRTVSDEFIKHEDTGLLAGSSAEFVNVLRDILSRPERLLSIGEAARREVLRRFSWESHLSKYDVIFDWLQRSEPRDALEF